MHAEIILRVRNFFENEKRNPEQIDINKVVERTAAATGVHRSLVSKIKIERDVENWKYAEGTKLSYATHMDVPETRAFN